MRPAVDSPRHDVRQTAHGPHRADPCDPCAPAAGVESTPAARASGGLFAGLLDAFGAHVARLAGGLGKLAALKVASAKTAVRKKAISIAVMSAIALVSVIYVLAGVAGAIAELAGGRPWVGHLVIGCAGLGVAWWMASADKRAERARLAKAIGDEDECPLPGTNR